MRDRIMTLALFCLVLGLLILTPVHPWPKWQWPCYIFCVLTLLWLLPDVAAALESLVRRPRITRINTKGRGK